jgi:hypothetical protein
MDKLREFGTAKKLNDLLANGMVTNGDLLCTRKEVYEKVNDEDLSEMLDYIMNNIKLVENLDSNVMYTICGYFLVNINEGEIKLDLNPPYDSNGFYKMFQKFNNEWYKLVE